MEKYTDAFFKALEKPPVLPAHIPADIFLGRPYHIMEETENRFLTILSGGIVEAQEPYSYVLRAFSPPPTTRMLLYTKEGGGVLRAGNKDHALTPQTLRYFDCSSAGLSPWKVEITGPVWKYIVFFITGNDLDAYEKLLTGKDPLLIHVKPHGTILPCIEKLLAGAEGTTLLDKLTDAALLHGILTELWTQALSLTNTYASCPPYLLEIKYTLDTLFMNPFRLQDLEDHYHISKYRICREFAAAFGKPPLRYLNDVRIEAAKNLLLTGDKRIHEIAAQVGIESATHFINLFKQRTGMTPLAFRDSMH